ncbi:MAG: tetratricopeptide repeat protein [Bdellovibrionales bacterium]
MTLKPRPLSTLLIACAAAMLLSACQTTNMAQNGGPNAGIDASMQRALSASRSKNANKSLDTLERIYTKTPQSEQAAIDYAAALRRNDNLNQAAIILAPFADGKEGSAAAKAEFAAIALAQGEYPKAEKYAQRAILQDEYDFEAFHYLGIALDAQGQHKEAERAFRKGLEMWEGDPTSIMNNLALNLASQEHLDEAAEILQKARMISPDRREVERNLRIVTALQQSNGTPVPKPMKKPNS